MEIIKRSSRNPILHPDPSRAWEAQAAFNGSPVRRGRKTYLLYRALSFPHYHAAADREIAVSDIGIAESADGISFKNRRPFIVPEESWDRFGCEDPRVTEFEGKYYIFYTALSTFPFGASGIRVGVAISDDLKTISEKHPVTPFNAKAMALFPERINGKIYAILTVNTDLPPSEIAVAVFDKPEDIWSEAYWNSWKRDLGRRTIPLRRRPEDQIEVGAPPIRTKDGWLFLYSYIRGYRGGNPLFTIEAALLDLNDPTKIVARADMPLMVPEEEYELYGIVPKIIFPSGLIAEKKKIHIYYGAADTTCCVASADLDGVIRFIRETDEGKNIQLRARFERSPDNPILLPIAKHPWESKAVFNPGAVEIDGTAHLLYRAQGADNTSVLGHAVLQDGFSVIERDDAPAYVPREPFEAKRTPGGNSGCEDSRLTRIGNKIHMCYTAYDGEHPPSVAYTSIGVDDFLAKRWDRWNKPVTISPPSFDDKDACLFPEKVKGKYLFFHRVGNDVDIAFVPSLDFSESSKRKPLEEERWLKHRPGFWDGEKVGIAAPPLKTPKGWILIYHGVSEQSHKYRVGALLLDRRNPTKIIGRTSYPLFEPQMPYEVNGQVSNVVFPCGAVLMGERVFIYYGGGDSVVGVASIPLKRILGALL